MVGASPAQQHLQQRRFRFRAWIGATLLFALALVLYQGHHDPEHDSSAVQMAQDDQLPQASPVRAVRAVLEPISQTPAEPELDSSEDAISLHGTEPDGQLGFDQYGRLIVDLELRRRFDYYLSTLGELDLAHLRELLEQQLPDQLSPHQLRQVMAEFDLYVAYLQAVEELLPAMGPDLRTRLQTLQRLQIDLLGTDRAQAWFGEDNDYLARTLDVMDGELDPGDPATDPWAEAMGEATGHHLALEMNLQYEQLQVDSAQRFAEREALYGAEAAQRLAQLDADRAAWQARVQAYAEKRSRLLANSSMSATEAEQRLAAWRQREFDPAEGRRFLALQRAGALDPSP